MSIAADRRTGVVPQQQIDECYDLVRGSRHASARLYNELHRASSPADDIRVSDWSKQLPERRTSRRQLRERTTAKNIFPLVTPQAMDPAHPFPFISNLSSNLLVTVRNAPGRPADALAGTRQGPGRTPARATLPTNSRDENDLRPARERDGTANLDLLFPEHGGRRELRAVPRHPQRQHRARRRSAQTICWNMIESELRERKFAPIVRLEVGKRHACRSTAACSPPSSASTSTPMSLRRKACWLMRDLMELTAGRGSQRCSDRSAFVAVDHASFARDRPESSFHVIRDSGGAAPSPSLPVVRDVGRALPARRELVTRRFVQSR